MDKQFMFLILFMLTMSGMLGYMTVNRTPDNTIEISDREWIRPDMIVFMMNEEEWECKFHQQPPPKMIEGSKLKRVEFEDGVPTYFWGLMSSAAKGYGFWYKVNILEACNDGTCYEVEHNQPSYDKGDLERDWHMIGFTGAGLLLALTFILCSIYYLEDDE